MFVVSCFSLTLCADSCWCDQSVHSGTSDRRMGQSRADLEWLRGDEEVVQFN